MGEITKNDEFSAAIIKTCQDLKLLKVLEIGSWDGTGSTQCFIEGMKDLPGDKLLDCLEIKSDRYNQLVENTKNYSWVKCHNTGSISYDSMLYKFFDEIWDSPFNKIPKEDQNGSMKPLVISWFMEDMNNLKQIKQGFIEQNNIFYDGILIDGSEFTGYSEFHLLRNRTNVFFLDDYAKAFKTNKVAYELVKSGEWDTVAGNKDTRNGWAILKRKNFINENIINNTAR